MYNVALMLKKLQHIKKNCTLIVIKTMCLTNEKTLKFSWHNFIK